MLLAGLKAHPWRTDGGRVATSRVSVASLPRAAALVVASGALYAFCYPPTPPEAGRGLAWVALAPLFLALRDRGLRTSAALAALWAVAATACVVRWVVPTLHGQFEWSSPASVGFLGVLAAVTAAPFFALTFGLARVGAGRRRLSPALFAAAFVSAEFLRGQIGLRSPWAPLGATQVDAERIRQLADLTGIYGVSGLVALVSAALAAALADARPWRRPRWPAARELAPAACAVLALLAAVAYGEWRIRDLEAASADPGRPALEVALVQGNLGSELRWKRSQASRALRRYGGLTRDTLAGMRADAAVRPPPDLVVWPENAIQTPVDDPIYGRPLLALARGAPLLLGAPRHERSGDGRRTFNSAHLITRDGHVASYDKRRLLPFGESRPLGALLAFGPRGNLDGGSWVAGRHPGVFILEGRRLGLLICLEVLHPELARDVVREGAELLVNLSNDAWFIGAGAREQHFAQTVFRAIETRRPLLRVTPTGITAVVSPSGEVEARLPEGTQGVLRASVAWPQGAPSLYARVGDVFAIGCALACAAPALQRGLGAARRRRAHEVGSRSA